MKLSILSLTLIFFISQTNCLYFHLYRDVKQCFYDEFYDELVVMVRYKILDRKIELVTPNEKRIEVTLYNSEDNQVVYRHETGKVEGKFSLTIEKTGHYKICIYSNDKDLFSHTSKLKFSLTIDTDQDELDNPEQVVKNKDFEQVDKKVKKLSKKANEITKMQDHQIVTEDEFSQTQFNSSNRIVMSTLISIVIMSIIGLWQIYSLRKIFKEKAMF